MSATNKQKAEEMAERFGYRIIKHKATEVDYGFNGMLLEIMFPDNHSSAGCHSMFLDTWREAVDFMESDDVAPCDKDCDCFAE